MKSSDGVSSFFLLRLLEIITSIVKRQDIHVMRQLIPVRSADSQGISGAFLYVVCPGDRALVYPREFGLLFFRTHRIVLSDPLSPKSDQNQISPYSINS